MQTTYLGQTAGGILKTANVYKTFGGVWEVFATTRDGLRHVAHIGGRRNGWGETIQDALYLCRADGVSATLRMSDRALARMRALEAQCEARMGREE